MKDKKIWNDWTIVIMMSLTLGLAPFVPEPHILGKVRWILGGAHGMKLIDWGDFLMHAIPFILLIRLIILKVIEKIQPARQQK
jgi:large-conductance mechanosensitive channel